MGHMLHQLGLGPMGSSLLFDLEAASMLGQSAALNQALAASALGVRMDLAAAQASVQGFPLDQFLPAMGSAPSVDLPSHNRLERPMRASCPSGAPMMAPKAAGPSRGGSVTLEAAPRRSRGGKKPRK